MTTLEPSLSPYPVDVLRSVLLELPFNEVMKLCKTQVAVSKICNDATFWADKSQRDFGVSTSTFHQRLLLMKISPAEVYVGYLDVYNVTQFLINVFEFGMLIKGWKGPGYHYYDGISGGINEQLIEERIDKIYDIINNTSLHTKKLIQNLPRLEYYAPSSKSKHDTSGRLILGRNELLQTKKFNPKIHFDRPNQYASMIKMYNKIIVYKTVSIKLITDIRNSYFEIGEINSYRKPTVEPNILIMNALIYLAKYGKKIKDFDINFHMHFRNRPRFLWNKELEDTYFDNK